MYVIIVGCGRLSSRLAKILASESYDVAVVDLALNTKALGSNFDGLIVEGDPMDQKALELAGIKKADLVVVATPDDNINSAVLQIASSLYGVSSTIARFTDPERERFYKDMGYKTICPTSTGVNQILDIIRSNSFSALTAFINPDMICVFPLDEWINKSIKEIAIPKDRVCYGIIRSGHILAMEKNVHIKEGDTLIFARTRRHR